MIDIDTLQRNILDAIRKEKSEVITEDSFGQKLQDKFLQPPLKYVKEKSNKIAGSEVAKREVSYNGTVFAEGSELSYVEFQFAIEGNYSHKDIVFNKAFLEENDLYFDTIKTNVYLIYKAYSGLAANGETDGGLEKINEQGTARRTLIQLRTEVFNQEVEQVNLGLKTFIHNALEEARQEIIQKKETLSQLDPF